MITFYLLLLIFLPNTSSYSTSETTDIAATDPTDPTDKSLVDCYSETKGQFIGLPFDEPVTTVHCSTSKYCQKMTANYLSIKGETHVTMRGCDEMSIPGIFEGVECDYEGCFERTIKDELYNICCCRGELCNASSNWRFLHLITLVSLYLVLC